MIAYRIEGTRRIRPQQILVPVPVKDEYSPENLEDLAKAHEAHGDFKKANAVRIHAQANFKLFTCPNGHISARPDSCGDHLCPWCRWHQLKDWGESLAERTGSETDGYSFETLLEYQSGTVESVKVMLRKTMHRHGGSPAFGFVPVRDNLWKVAVVVTGLNASGRDEALSAFRDLALIPELVVMRSFPLDELGQELDRIMPRLRDFQGHEGKLLEYVGIDFGKRLMSKQLDKPQNSDDELPDELHDTEPPKMTSVSLRSENAIETGQRCRICDEPIVFLGEYCLEGAVFRKLSGNGPVEIPASDVFDSSGELSVRLRQGRYARAE